MLGYNQRPLLDIDAVKQPLAYEHEVDAALFLGALDQEPTETERLAAAYYLQHRTAQLTGNVALTGAQVAEKVEEMVEDVQNAGFVRSLVDDYQAASEPQSSLTLAKIWEIYKPDTDKRPKIGQVLIHAVEFSPAAFLIDYVGFGEIMSEPSWQRIGGTILGSLLAGYATTLRRKHNETTEDSVVAVLPSSLSHS